MAKYIINFSVSRPSAGKQSVINYGTVNLEAATSERAKGEVVRALRARYGDAGEVTIDCVTEVAPDYP